MPTMTASGLACSSAACSGPAAHRAKRAQPPIRTNVGCSIGVVPFGPAAREGQASKLCSTARKRGKCSWPRLPRSGRPPSRSTSLAIIVAEIFAESIARSPGACRLIKTTVVGNWLRVVYWAGKPAAERGIVRGSPMVVQKRLTVQTAGPGDSHDLTAKVQEIVDGSGIGTGLAHVFNLGSTAAVGTIELEPGLQRDLPELLCRLIPPSRNYGHEQAWHDGNGHSHLQATLLGQGLTVPVTNGQLALGTWQQVFLLECDTRPRRREVVVTVIGE